MKGLMARSRERKPRKQKKLKVGARVGYRLGSSRPAPALVIEDVGPIGVEGRQWVRIRVLKDDEPEFDIAAERLVPAP